MKTIIIFVAMIVLFASGCNNMQKQPSLVKVESGMVQGIVDSGLTVFKGIPFSAPPVGDLRWRAPQPALFFMPLESAGHWHLRSLPMMV